MCSSCVIVCSFCYSGIQRLVSRNDVHMGMKNLSICNSAWLSRSCHAREHHLASICSKVWNHVHCLHQCCLILLSDSLTTIVTSWHWTAPGFSGFDMSWIWISLVSLLSRCPHASLPGSLWRASLLCKGVEALALDNSSQIFASLMSLPLAFNGMNEIQPAEVFSAGNSYRNSFSICFLYFFGPILTEKSCSSIWGPGTKKVGIATVKNNDVASLRATEI